MMTTMPKTTLVQKIKSDSTLQPYLCLECEENGIAAVLAPNIPVSEVVIIRVDQYYNTQVKNPPRSPDCLIIQHCNANRYELCIVELKNIQGLQKYSLNAIREKYQTCFSDFMSNRFRHYFYDLTFTFKQIRLLFISDPQRQLQNPSYQKKDKNTRLDALLALPPCRFANKLYGITHELPNPMIRKC